MRKRFGRRTTIGVLAGVATALSVAAMASVGAAFSPASPSASAKQYEPKKVTVCHRTGSKKNPFRTITVSQNALKAHLKHGDALGPCSSAVFTMCHKTKSGKHDTMKVKGSRKAEHRLKKGDKLGKCSAGKKAKPAKPEKGKHKGHGKQKGKGKPKKK